jgi:polysaccharide pyruvyl transferase WcaK-like protein
MLRCLREWLDQQQIAVTVLSEYPEETSREFDGRVLRNVPLCGEWAWREAWGRGHAARLLQALARCDALCVGGGDLLRDDQGVRSFVFAVEKLIFALLMRKPVYLLNVGISEPTTWYGRQILRWIVPSCRHIVVRDDRSLAVCRALGGANHTELRRDIVLDLPELLDHRASAPTDAPPPDPYVVVAVRGNPNAFHAYPVDDHSLRTFAASLDAMVDEQDVGIWFLPFQDAPDEAEVDHAIHERIAAMMRRSDRVMLLPWTRDLGRVAAVVARARLVIAMRLHAAVLAVAYRRPCVVMPYDRKVVEFARQADISSVIWPETLRHRDRLVALYNAALEPLRRGAARVERLPGWLRHSEGTLTALGLRDLDTLPRSRLPHLMPL